MKLLRGFRGVYVMFYLLSCIYSFKERLFHHPTGAVTMAACLASKGDNLAPTTSAALTFSLFSFVPNNAAFSQKPFKWREYTLKINVPTLCVQLIAAFALPKRKLARPSPCYSPEEWLNAELRATVYSNNGNARENNERQCQSNSLQKIQQQKKGGV